MTKSLALLSLLLTIFIISGCQTTPINVPTSSDKPAQEPVRTTPVDVLSEFIAPQAITPQVIFAPTGNIFENGGFESGLTGWGACDPAAIELSTDAHEGANAIKVNAGKCFYRSAAVNAGQNYTLSCYAKILSGSAWTGMGMGFSDLSFNELSQAPVAIISGASYARYDSKATAPADARYVSMWFYSDNVAAVDSCSLLLDEEQPEPPTEATNLLESADFTTTNSITPINWTVGCGGTLVPNTYNVSLQNGACFDQGLSAADISALAGNNFTYSCSVNNASGYASMSIFLDGIAQSKAITTTQGYQIIEISGTAPAQLSNGFVSLYGEGTLNIQECTVTVESAPTPEPHPENLLTNGSFDATDSGWTSCSANSLNIANGSLLVSNGDCIYQTVPAVSGSSYQVVCEAQSTQTGWNNIILDFLDANWQSTGNKSNILVRSEDLKDYSLTSNTPSNAAHVAVSFYAEGQLSVDSCILKESTTTPVDASNLLTNGGFEAGSTGWSGNCTHTYTSDATKVRSGNQAAELRVNTPDCIEQTFTGLTPGNYAFSCYYQVQSEFLLTGPNAPFGYRYYFNAGTSGGNLLLPINELDSYRLHTISATVNNSGTVKFGFSGQGLLFDDCSFTAR